MVWYLIIAFVLIFHRMWQWKKFWNGQYLAKINTKVWWHVSLTDGVNIHLLTYSQISYRCVWWITSKVMTASLLKLYLERLSVTFRNAGTVFWQLPYLMPLKQCGSTESYIRQILLQLAMQRLMFSSSFTAAQFVLQNQTVNDGVAHSKNPRKCVSRDLWPWPWPWAQPGCRLTRRPSCASLVAIRPFACEKKRFAQKFTDGRTDRQTDDGRLAIVLAHSWNELKLF